MCEHIIVVMGTLSYDLRCSYCSTLMPADSDGWVCLACGVAACMNCGEHIKPTGTSPVAIVPVSAFPYPDPPNLE